MQIATPTAKGTITDDDPLIALVASGQTTAPEGETATFVVTLTKATSSAPVVVNYDVGGTATVEDGDYTAPSGKLTIRAGASTGTISIQTLDDGVLDRGAAGDGETLTVTLMGGDTAGDLTATAGPVPDQDRRRLRRGLGRHQGHDGGRGRERDVHGRAVG